MFEIKVQKHFSAAHHLLNYNGVCEKQHGHNWKVEVYVRGNTLNNSNILMDFKDLKAILDNEKIKEAMAEVLPADSYVEIPYLNESGSPVKAIHMADDKGYVVQVAPSGFGGLIEMMVGVDNEGKCTGVSIVSMKETAGLGAKASKEDFRAQFVGQGVDVAVTKDGGKIDALTGATITSRAVADGVAAAIEAVEAL